MDFKYISIPRAEAEKLGLAETRNGDGKGNVIVNQTDLHTYGSAGESLTDKVTKLNGEILTHSEARLRITKAR